MDWLSNWDDLIHGTVVFSAIIPFLLVLALGWKVPAPRWWLLVALALVPVVYWLFRLPSIPPEGSDDIVALGVLAAVAILSLEFWLAKLGWWPLRLVLRAVVFFAIASSVYPAWLASEEYAKYEFLICAGFGGSIALWSITNEWLAESGEKRRQFSITPAAWIPPTIALAVLLQTGGSMRFAQVTGALAAGTAALCLMMLLRRDAGASKPGRTGSLWGILFVLLGWSGWLFAEIRYGLACLLLCAPLVAALVGLIPILPRKNLFLCQMWDFLASALVALPVAAVAVLDYAAEMAEFEGY